MLLALTDSRVLNVLFGPVWIVWSLGVLKFSHNRRRRNFAAVSITLTVLFYLFTLH